LTYVYLVLQRGRSALPPALSRFEVHEKYWTLPVTDVRTGMIFSVA
jgi:hypothetical protein